AQVRAPDVEHKGGLVSLDGVTLTARFTIAGDRLDVQARVTNGTSSDVYVIDTAFKVGPGGVEVRPDHLEVKYEGPETAVLSSNRPPFDPPVRWAVPPTAYGTRVAPGATHEAMLGARLPLHPEGVRPHRGPDGTIAEPLKPPIVCSRVR